MKTLFYKRYLPILLSVILISIPCISVSEGDINSSVDLTSLSIEKLLLLKEGIDAELAKRGNGVQTLLPVGAYLAGKDIAAGQYDIHFHCDDYGSITIAVLKEGISLETIAQISYEDQLKYLAVPPTNLYAPGVVHLSIEENQTLYVEIVSGTGVLTIEKVNGLFQ